MEGGRDIETDGNVNRPGKNKDGHKRKMAVDGY